MSHSQHPIVYEFQSIMGIWGGVKGAANLHVGFSIEGSRRDGSPFHYDNKFKIKNNNKIGIGWATPTSSSKLFAGLF